MTDTELHELDTLIAEKFMGWKPLEGEPPITARDGKIFIDITGYDSFNPSVSPAAFSLVKHEIEKHRWNWICSYENITAFKFSISIPGIKTWVSFAESEELAGCLTIKKIVEEGMAVLQKRSIP